MADYDVVIIGTGAAGLAAAAVLVRGGYTVALVEARERVGGRVHTIRPPLATLPVELGADFVHGRPPEVFSIAEEAGLRLYEHTGTSWVALGGRLQSDEDEAAGEDDPDDNEDEDGDDVSAIFAAIEGWQGEDRSLQDLFDARFAGERWARARQRVSRYVEGFDAADVDRVSVAWLQQAELASDAMDGNRQFRVLDGYDRVLTWLSDGLGTAADLRLQTVAREIRWRRGHAEVRLESPAGAPLGAISARVALITVPLGVLKRSFDDPETPGAVRLTPEPPGKREALARLGMGHAVKVVLRFRLIFWDALPQELRPDHKLVSLPQFSFMFADDPVIPTWWTAHPVVAPLLTGWTAGPRAARLANASDEAIADEAVAALSRVLGIERDDLNKLLVGKHTHNWSADPFSSGGYSYVYTGGLAAPAMLAEPVEETLFFAGEATNTEGDTGTVHGALQTGYRAGEAIARALVERG